MSLLDLFVPSRAERALRVDEQIGEVQAALGTVDPSTFPFASPWSSSNMERIVYQDVFGDTLPNTRAYAMKIPSVAKARNLICNSIQKLPLVQLAPGETVPEIGDVEAWVEFFKDQPSWLSRCVDGSTPQNRLAWTADDLLFYGWSCWWRHSGSDRFPLDAGRVNMGSWRITADNTVEIDGIPKSAEEVIIFQGIHEGILSYGRDALADAHELIHLVRQRLKNPVPATELHQTEGPDLPVEQRDELIKHWREGRERGDNIGYTSKHIEVKTHGTEIEQQLMIEARNAMAVEIARMVSISAGLLDATTPKASLNYETQSGRNQEFYDRDLSLYADPIANRLSNDDVSPRSKRVRFDLTDFTAPVPSPTGPERQD